MISLSKSVLLKSIIEPRTNLLNGKFMFYVSNFNIINYSNKYDDTNDCCKPSTTPPCCLPPPPECCKPETKGSNDNMAVKSTKQYTLLKDLSKKGIEIFHLVRNSNEYDYAKEKIKKLLNLTYAYIKQYGSLMQKNVSGQVAKIKSKNKDKVDPPQPKKK